MTSSSAVRIASWWAGFSIVLTLLASSGCGTDCSCAAPEEPLPADVVVALADGSRMLAPPAQILVWQKPGDSTQISVTFEAVSEDREHGLWLLCIVRNEPALPLQFELPLRPFPAADHDSASYCALSVGPAFDAISEDQATSGTVSVNVVGGSLEGTIVGAAAVPSATFSGTTEPSCSFMDPAGGVDVPLVEDPSFSSDFCRPFAGLLSP